MKKVLFLDALEGDADRIQELSLLQDTLSAAGAQCTFYSVNGQKGIAPEKFAEDFKHEVDESALIIGLGNYHWLLYFNKHLGVHDHLIGALRAGKPFIFQAVRAWEKFYSRHAIEDSQYVRSVFDCVGVQPTSVKVFTDDSPTEIGGGAMAFFRSGDNCFLNADVLGEAHEILLRQPNILAFDRGVFPVAETGSLHYLVDEGDWETELDIGMRPAVFVEVKNANVKGFVVSGGLLRDAYQSISGSVPGAEYNLIAIKALIDKALTWSRKGPSFEMGLYQDLHDFERGLGRILQARLSPTETYSLKDAQLRELIDVACSNWKSIEDLFEYQSMAEFSRSCSAIPAGVRNYISHPIRLNSEQEAISTDAAQLLNQAAEAVRLAEQRLKNSKA